MSVLRRPGRQETPGVAGELPGIAVAFITALVGGVAIFVNDHGVRAIAPAAAYTTAKNLVATVLLVRVAAAGWAARHRSPVLGRFVRSPGTAAGRPPPPGGGAGARSSGWASHTWARSAAASPSSLSAAEPARSPGPRRST